MRMSALRVLIAEIRKHETELSDIERSLQGTPQIPFRDHTKGIPTWVSLDITNQCVHKCIYIYICIYVYVYNYIIYIYIYVYVYVYISFYY